ncbi:hypothetical protein T4B_14830 [Trichinella pseudospiralis]|uniref:Uncharacterized protein n=1 Tax=Trichinella pseudospiralis TaxID=6337 RepID=A0A0V1JGX1_TRIPS|nr:hypothetical protein T4B_14830 [Trichinella pseudospiralis]
MIRLGSSHRRLKGEKKAVCNAAENDEQNFHHCNMIRQFPEVWLYLQKLMIKQSFYSQKDFVISVTLANSSL